MKILHCITGLTPDGAQRQLLRLVKELEAAGHTNHIVSLSKEEDFAKKFYELGVRVDFLNMKKGMPDTKSLKKLAAILKDQQADVLQGWMYHANIYLWLATLFKRPAPLFWSIRRSLYEQKQLKMHTRLTIQISALISKQIRKIIYCTEESKVQHIAAGFSSKNALVIENGFDLDVIKSSSEFKPLLRQLTNVSKQTKLVGIVGRFDISKNFPLFFQAARLVANHIEDISFVCIGRGLEETNADVQALIHEHGLTDKVFLLGQQAEAYKLMSGLDVYCSSSRSEGFPNTIAEAMATEVPCAVTDVGAARLIVGDCGKVVPSQDARALARAIQNLLELSTAERAALGVRCRARIQQLFSIQTCCEAHIEAYAAEI